MFMHIRYAVSAVGVFIHQLKFVMIGSGSHTPLYFSPVIEVDRE